MLLKKINIIANVAFLIIVDKKFIVILFFKNIFHKIENNKFIKGNFYFENKVI